MGETSIIRFEDRPRQRTSIMEPLFKAAAAEAEVS